MHRSVSLRSLGEGRVALSAHWSAGCRKAASELSASQPGARAWHGASQLVKVS